MVDVVAIGSVNIDLIARVKRFPKADEEVSVDHLSTFHGGSAANVAVGIARLGHSSGFVGVIGGDRFGEMLLQELEKEKVNTSHVKRLEGNSGMVFAAVDPSGERILYASRGVSSAFDRTYIPVDYIKRARFIHITSIMGEKAIDALEFASITAKDNNVGVIFDPGTVFAEKGAKALKGILGNCSVIVPNNVEARMLTGVEGEEAGKKLLEYGPKVAIITMGSKGCVLVTKDFIKGIPSLETKGIDTTGAGDSFVAGFLCGLLEDKDLERAAEFGNRVAAMSIKKMGARGTPQRHEIGNSR